MRRVILVYFSVILFLISCSSEDKPGSNKPTLSYSATELSDTIRVKKMDLLIDSLKNALLTKEYKKTKLNPGYLHPEDEIVYFSRNDSLKGLYCGIENDSLADQHTYILVDGKLVWARKRFWNKLSASPDAGELIFYLDDDTIFYISEKYVTLEPGQAPAMIGRMPVQPSKRPVDSLQKELFTDWNNIYQLVLGHMQGS